MHVVKLRRAVVTYCICYSLIYFYILIVLMGVFFMMIYVSDLDQLINIFAIEGLNAHRPQLVAIDSKIYTKSCLIESNVRIRYFWRCGCHILNNDNSYASLQGNFSRIQMASIDLFNDIDNSYNIPCHVIDTIESCKTYFKGPNDFKLICLNIRSITKNFDMFITTLYRSQVHFDVIIFTECWLTESTLIKNIPGYHFYKTNNLTNQNSGVVIYIKNTWNVTVTEPDLADTNCLAVEFPERVHCHRSVPLSIRTHVLAKFVIIDFKIR